MATMSADNSSSSDTRSVDRAGLQEIFSSIQGEGPFVGKRQIFVRFNACHLKCLYCDTPQKPAAQRCQFEFPSGSGQFKYFDNPMSADDVLGCIEHLHASHKHHSISFTGGEPLLYTDFLKPLLPKLRLMLPVYLETSGTQPDKLSVILDQVDIIAMDIKLPSTTREPMQLAAHQAFYQLSREKAHFVKLVFGNTTPAEELLATCDIVTVRDCPIILQPMTDRLTGDNTVHGEKMLWAYDLLSAYFSDVRVIGQTHKLLNVL